MRNDTAIRKDDRTVIEIRRDEGKWQNDIKKGAIEENIKPTKELTEKELKDRKRNAWLFHNQMADHLVDADFAALDDPRYHEAKFEYNISNSTLLHSIVNEFRGKEEKLTPKVLKYIEDIVLEKPEFFTHEDINEKIPMKEAATSPTPILFLVLGLLLPKPACTALYENRRQCREDGRCLIPECRRKQFQIRKSEQSRGSSGSFTPTLQADTSNRDGFCLHSEINVQGLLKADEELRQMLRKALEPIEQTRDLFTELISERNFDLSAPKIKLDGIDSLLDLCPEEVFIKSPETGFTPLQKAVDIISKGRLDLELLFKFTELLVDRFPASIFCNSMIGKQSKNVFQLFQQKSRLNTAADWTQKTAKFKMLLERKCIGYREEIPKIKASQEVKYDYKWSDKKDLLYPDPTTGKQVQGNLLVLFLA